MIDLLARVVLAAGLDLDHRDLLDVLWLVAARATDGDAAVDGAGGSSAARTAEPDRQLTPAPGVNPSTALPPTADGVSLYPPGADVDGGTRRARAVNVPQRGVLADPLALARALRPFKRVREPGTPVLDVEATVNATAEARRLVPVSRPEPRRRLDVALVVDAGLTVQLWAEAVHEFQRILEQVGAFRSVSRWELDLGADPDGVVLRDGAGAAQPIERLIDPSGRRVVLVVTDAVAAPWYRPACWAVINRWGTAMPTAVVQTLPEPYWRVTGLGDDTVLVRSPSPAAANESLSVQVPWWAETSRGQGAAAPVVGLTGQGLARWARAVVDGTTWTAAVSTVDTPRDRLSSIDDAQVTAVERVDFFRSQASQGAQRLMELLSLAPLISLPVLRVLQAALLPATGVLEITEVMVSGLLERHPEAGLREPLYRFRPEVAKLLSQGATLEEEWQTYDAVTRYLNTPGPTGVSAFEGFVPDESGSVAVDARARPFAVLLKDLTTRLGLEAGSGTGPEPGSAPASSSIDEAIAAIGTVAAAEAVPAGAREPFLDESFRQRVLRRHEDHLDEAVLAPLLHGAGVRRSGGVTVVTAGTWAFGRRCATWLAARGSEQVEDDGTARFRLDVALDLGAGPWHRAREALDDWCRAMLGVAATDPAFAERARTLSGGPVAVLVEAPQGSLDGEAAAGWLRALAAQPLRLYVHAPSTLGLPFDGWSHVRLEAPPAERPQQLGSSRPSALGSDAGPYFFLAYAHTPERPWVERLFQDLSAEIFERTVLPVTAGVGFMDGSAIPVGGDWRDEVARALATCRVFVPLYSPRYFTRPECGIEWHAFSQRILDHRSRFPGNPAPIVPALWIPVDPEDLPEAARRVQMNHADLGAEYAQEGFYTLIKNSLYRQQYVTAVQRLAQHVIRAAESARLQPCRVNDLGPRRNAFEAPGRQAPADRRLTIVVAAPTVDRLPPGRNPAYYGSAAHDWNPFYPASRQTIADYARGVARLNSYEPTVLGLEEGLDFLSRSDASDGLGLLLVDAWVTEDEGTMRRLAELDRSDRGWVTTVVPWNPDDDQTAQRAEALRERLQVMLPRQLGGSRASAPLVSTRITTLEQFRSRLPDVLEQALFRYLNHAEAHPPTGRIGPRPRLHPEDHVSDGRGSGEL